MTKWRIDKIIRRYSWYAISKAVIIDFARPCRQKSIFLAGQVLLFCCAIFGWGGRMLSLLFWFGQWVVGRECLRFFTLTGRRLANSWCLTAKHYHQLIFAMDYQHSSVHWPLSYIFFLAIETCDVLAECSGFMLFVHLYSWVTDEGRTLRQWFSTLKCIA